MLNQAVLLVFVISFCIIGVICMIYGSRRSGRRLPSVSSVLRGEKATPNYFYKSEEGKTIRFDPLYLAEYEERLDKLQVPLDKLDLIEEGENYAEYGYAGRVAYISIKTSKNQDSTVHQLKGTPFYTVTPLTSSLTENPAQHPPKLTEYLLFFLPKEEQEILMGDLEEEYWEKFEKLGRRQATRWYWQQVATSFWPLLIETIKKRVLRAIRRWIS
jgi:hypothetical protein